VRLADLDYRLPDERIAQHPPHERDGGRLLVVDRASGGLSHNTIRDLPLHLHCGDLLIRNRSRVMPARLIARRETGGRVEVLLVAQRDDGRWHALIRPAARLRDAEEIVLDSGDRLRVHRDGADLYVAGDDVAGAMERCGLAPLPPYIRRPAQREDIVRYQTVYAAESGSCAAPTAGLHLSTALLGRLNDRGVSIADVVLHVGPGTFLPVRVKDLDEHRMHRERFSVEESVVEAVRRTAAAGRRTVAVGTTVVRCLESAASDGSLTAGSGETELFIRPGHRFRVVEALLTNFHQPRSTLLALVAAFAGLELIRAAYAEALREDYRFLSYGDAMLIV